MAHPSLFLNAFQISGGVDELPRGILGILNAFLGNFTKRRSRLHSRRNTFDAICHLLRRNDSSDCCRFMHTNTRSALAKGKSNPLQEAIANDDAFDSSNEMSSLVQVKTTPTSDVSAIERLDR